MSLLSAIEEAIESCKTEQARIDGRIQHYREILRSLTSRPKIGFEEPESADDPATGTDTSPGEKEDIELLERALEKALQVRTGTGSSQKDTNKQPAPPKEPGTSGVTSKDGKQTSAAKGNQTTTRSTSKSARKEHKRPGVSVSITLGTKPSARHIAGQYKTADNRNISPKCPVSSTGILHHQAERKSQQSVSTFGSLDPDQIHTSTLLAKRKTIRSNDLGKATAVSIPSSYNTAPVLQTGESGVHSLPQHNRMACDESAKWKTLRRKQNRLWDKVAALQRKPVPGRSHFMERMRAMFPKDWPCGSPDQTRALVDSLTDQGRDLTQRCQTKDILAKQTSGAATEQGCEPLERLQMTAAEVQNFAGQVKQEWDAWDRWRPEGGCLCPTGANGVWGDGIISPLPPTITYTAEAELRELEKLRMRVALLRQEIYLEQALLDTLSPQLPSIVPRPECSRASVLRDVYSLLGEGGQHFPAIVVDSDPD